jgi:hypothetical protein
LPLGRVNIILGRYTVKKNLKKYDTNFDAPDALFDLSSVFSDARDEKVGNPRNKVKTERANKNQNREP